MKNILCIIACMAGILTASSLRAQDILKKKPKKDHSKDMLVISNHGIKIESHDTTVKTHMLNGKDTSDIGFKDNEKRFSFSVLLFDLGINILQDNTNYSALSPGAARFLNVPAGMQNKDLFDLRTAKSVNVNLYPFMERFRVLKTPGQRIYLATGLGLQIYNFRFENPITYTRNPAGVTLNGSSTSITPLISPVTPLSFKKDKLSVEYLSVPLMLTFKTRIHKDAAGKAKKDTWLVYGAGISEGLRINSWTKQKSDMLGKVKVHDQFGLADFNTCLTAEFGVEGIIRFFASYQVTALYQNGIDQHPVSFGIRLSGI